MAFDMLTSGKLTGGEPYTGNLAGLLDLVAPEIMLKGLGRPWQLLGAHGVVLATNYVGFFLFVRRDLVRWLFGRCGRACGEESERQAKRSLASLLFVKFLVWQHLAEAIGCRQGPLAGFLGLPNNWKYRLSLGTLKYPLVPFLGKRRNLLDLFVHILFFAFGAAFLQSREYKLKYIRALCACDVWICCSDLSQFFASTGHAYFSMLLSACFPEGKGRLAGMQAALIIQWFFSGVGKIGPWFAYVNAPFMLQSKILGGRRWLFDLLVKSPTDLSPTLVGQIVAHTAAAVEYIGPLCLMWPMKYRDRAASADSLERTTKDTLPARATSHSDTVLKHRNSSNRLAKTVRFLGVAAVTSMHAYILSMPAPFDVYSWNVCFGLSSLYLFLCASFGFDYASAKAMPRGLAAYFLAEVAVCWYGQLCPDRIGYYFSHRYWAGNWVHTFFYVKNTAASKLERVKTCSTYPQVWLPLEPLSMPSGLLNLAYLWLANLNMKALLPLVDEARRLVGGPGAKSDEYSQIGLTQFCCGEFRDALYALPLLPAIQEQIGFDAGECFMVRLGAFGMFQDTATWGIYDLKEGLVKSGLLRIPDLLRMHALPSQSVAAHSLAALMD